MTETTAIAPPIVFDNTPTVVVTRVPIVRDGKVGLLMIRRALKDGFGKLALPGGWQVKPNSLHQTGADEVEEETGVLVDPATLRVTDGKTTPTGAQNLLFLDAPITVHEGDFVHDHEVSEVTVIYEPVETAFPIHTDMVKQWFDDLYPLIRFSAKSKGLIEVPEAGLDPLRPK